ASAPQRPHRIPLSRPARDSSKKPFRWITRSVTAEQAHQNGRGIPAESMGEPGGSALHLTGPGLTAELGDDLHDLGGAGGADRVALGLQAPGRVDREPAPEARPALLGREAAGARLEEAQALGGDDLGDREAVVELHDVDVGRGLAGLTVGALRG